MKEFFRHLKAAWNYGRIFPYIEAATVEEFWTEEESKAVAHFFDSYAGKKFKIRLRNFSIQTAVGEAVDLNSPRGKAAGAFAVIAFMDSHFPQEEQQPEQANSLEQLETETA